MTPWRARRRACTPRPCDPPPSASPRLRSAGRLARRRAGDDDPARVRLLRAPGPPVLQDEASLAAADAARDAQDAAEPAASVAQRAGGLADDGRPFNATGQLRLLLDHQQLEAVILGPVLVAPEGHGRGDSLDGRLRAARTSRVDSACGCRRLSARNFCHVRVPAVCPGPARSAPSRTARVPGIRTGTTHPSGGWRAGSCGAGRPSWSPAGRRCQPPGRLARPAPARRVWPPPRPGPPA